MVTRKQFEVYLANLDAILARVACTFQGKEGQIVLDQIRTVDKTRLVHKLGQITKATQTQVLDVLVEMFNNGWGMQKPLFAEI